MFAASLPLLVPVAFLIGRGLALVQHPFSESIFQDEDYHLQRTIRKVAIIGAGPSGLVTYRELVQAGFDVRLFERDNVPGGNWHYTEETAADAPVPNAPIPVGDYTPSLPRKATSLPFSETYQNDEWGRIDHRGPKPVWDSLTSNAPAPLQQVPELPWPEGTPWKLTQYQLRNYVRAFASFHGINSNDNNPATSYNTRVELAEKLTNADGEEEGWRLWLKKLEVFRNGTSEATWWTEDFDAVAVASGRYQAPFMPHIPGLAEMAERFPDEIMHARQYRCPQSLTGKTVMIVGAATSGAEISRDINRWAGKVYQSIKANTSGETGGDDAINYILRLPANTTKVSQIKRFLPLDGVSSVQGARVELVNGTVLTGIDHFIFATGYRYSFPFLPQYYDSDASSSLSSNVPPNSSSKAFLPLDGTHLRELHQDLFWIRDPTLAFLGINFGPGVQTFLFTDYLALALAKVWSGTAFLPSQDEMWKIHEERVHAQGGYGHGLHLIESNRFRQDIRYFVAWLNDAAVRYGGKQIEGLPKYYDEVKSYFLKAISGGH